jgi:hypothetical protein
MKSFIKLSILLISFIVCKAEYEGPYLLWGLEGLDDIKVPALQGIKDKKIIKIVSIFSLSELIYQQSMTKF